MSNHPSLNLPYIIFAGVLVIGIVATFTVFVPTYNGVQDIITKTKETSDKLTDRRAFLQTVDAKKAELATQAPRERELNVVLPVGDNLEDIMRVIDRAAQTSGVNVNSIQNSSAGLQVAQRAQAASKDPNVLPANVVAQGLLIKITGGYPQLRGFITEMEKSPRLTDVTQLTLRRDDKQPDQVNGDVALQYYSYHKPEPL